MARNIPLFIAFRVLFNARFYYPVFAVIQLDYGLSMTQFALLNAIWAVSIVVLEVPSGALADRFGRRRLVVAASVLMVVEMALIAFVPLGNATLVFWVWVLNRILSGAAEAAASGADEALAYDSLPEESRLERWPRVLSRLMMLSSLAFVVAMLVGAASYDAAFINRILAGLGSSLELESATVMRFPVYLTLASALATVAVALMMREAPKEDRGETIEDRGGKSGSRPPGTLHPVANPPRLFGDVMEAGRWVLGHPLVFALLLAALVHDSLVRLFITTSSQYYRLIEIPEAWFGVIGAALAALGILTPKIAEYLVRRRSRVANYVVVSVLLLIGLAGASLALPLWGVAAMLFVRVGMTFLNYFSSHYLNAEVDSRRRATVLSFKGLALNLGFGALSLAYAGLLGALTRAEGSPGVEGAPSAEPYAMGLLWFPFVFALMVAGFYAKWGSALRGAGGLAAKRE